MAKKQNPIKVSMAKVELKSTMDLVVSKDPGSGIIKWGKDNRYPSYLLKLYKGQPQHQGIVNGKAKYITGISIKSSNPQANEWLKKANPKEGWYDVLKKANKNFNIYGARAVKIIPNAVGQPIYSYFIDFGRCRISDCEKYVKYCDDWSDKLRCGVENYPIWYQGCKVPAVYIYKNHNTAVKKIEAAYPALEYEAAIKDIDTLVRVQNSRNSLVINDFSGSIVCYIKGGKPETKAEEKELVARIRNEYTGDENTGNMPVVFVDSGDQSGVEFASAPTENLDKKHIEVRSASTKNVFAAHDVPPDLFSYISDNAPLFGEGKAKLIAQQELFMNSYVIPEQENVLNMLTELYKARTGQVVEFEIEQFDPIGQDLPLDNQVVVDALNAADPNIIPNWIAKKYKITLPPKSPTVGPTGTAPVQQAEVNDHLKNLTARQSQGIMRIVKKYNSGDYSEAMAKILLKNGFGLTDQDCNEFLGIGVNQSVGMKRLEYAMQDRWLSIIRKHKFVIPDDHEVMETKFAKDSVLSIRGIWDRIIGKDKKDTPKTDEPQYEFYTAYTYGLREDVKGPVILPTTRDWCRKTYEEFRLVRTAIPVEAIEEMTNDFGMNAFDYRGGFYNNGVETTPWCRHAWFAHTVRKRIN